MALQDYILTMQDSTPPGLGANALDVLKLLVKQSGRYDLVADAENEDWTDNGGFEVINEAQVWLDEMCDHPKGDAWYYAPLEIGQFKVAFRFKRLIKEIWISDATTRTRLVQVSLSDLRDQLDFASPVGNIDPGRPRVWSPAALGLAPDIAHKTEGDFEDEEQVDYEHIEFGSHFMLNGFIFYPSADDAYTVEVLAEWYTAEITDGTDITFWTANHRHLLVKAARFILETDHRNSQGQDDWLKYLLPRLERIENADRRERANRHYSQMEVRG